MFKQAIKWGDKDPKKLFMIDGFGATLSALLLGIVLVKLEKYFGIPRSTLYFLVLFPLLFAVYDMYCFRKKTNDIGKYLKVIALLNITYCILSISIAFYHLQEITYLGWSYIIFEITVVFTFATIELKVARKLILERKDFVIAD